MHAALAEFGRRHTEDDTLILLLVNQNNEFYLTNAIPFNTTVLKLFYRTKDVQYRYINQFDNTEILERYNSILISIPFSFCLTGIKEVLNQCSWIIKIRTRGSSRGKDSC